MGAIEDGRKLIQDFLAPELRAIAVRLDGLEKKVDENECRADARHADSLKAADARHADTLTAIARLADYTSLRERVVRLESKDSPHQ